MKEQLLERLEQLKAEFESGQKKLTELEVQAGNMRNTLLRISGAIQVLEEELAKVDTAHTSNGASSGEAVVAMPSSGGAPK
jgi:predicted nuclease with TOPRIM domain